MHLLSTYVSLWPWFLFFSHFICWGGVLVKHPFLLLVSMELENICPYTLSYNRQFLGVAYGSLINKLLATLTVFDVSPCSAAKKYKAGSSGWVGPCQERQLKPARWVQYQHHLMLPTATEELTFKLRIQGREKKSTQKIFKKVEEKGDYFFSLAKSLFYFLP